MILRNGVFQQVIGVLHDLTYNAGGWRIEKHVRLVGDTMGNDTSDLIGFGDAGVLISRNNGNNTFQPVRLVIKDYGYNAGGWRVERHPRFVADLRKTGRVDIIGFGNAGVLVSKNNGNLNFAPQILGLNNFGYNQGWRTDRHLRFLADITGDGFMDIVGFGEKYVYVATGKGDGTFNGIRSVINDFTIGAGGWQINKHPRLLGDITGDGKADIVGFGNAGVYVALNKGDGTFHPPKLVLKDFGYMAGGWRVEKHPRFLADVNGDGKLDIVGFGDAGVYIAISNGDGTFKAPMLAIKNFGYNAGGWRVEKHLRFPVDITGDGSADIVGFGENSVWVSYNDGKGNLSSPIKKLTDEFAFRGGQWDMSKTVRFVTNLY